MKILKKKEIGIENMLKEANDLSLMASKKKDFDLLFPTRNNLTLVK